MGRWYDTPTPFWCLRSKGRISKSTLGSVIGMFSWLYTHLLRVLLRSGSVVNDVVVPSMGSFLTDYPGSVVGLDTLLYDFINKQKSNNKTTLINVSLSKGSFMVLMFFFSGPPTNNYKLLVYLSLSIIIVRYRIRLQNCKACSPGSRVSPWCDSGGKGFTRWSTCPRTKEVPFTGFTRSTHFFYVEYEFNDRYTN